MAQQLTDTAPIERGLVRRFRGSSDLMAPLRGGIHERTSSRQTSYPYLVYSLVSAPFVQDWGAGTDQGQREIDALYDISILATNQVQANTLSQLIDNLLHDREVELDALVDGQTVWFCQSVAVMPTGPDKDDEGRYYVQKGHTYRIRTYQPIPKPEP